MPSTSALICVAFVSLVIGGACAQPPYGDEAAPIAAPPFPTWPAAGSGGARASWHASITMPDARVGSEDHVCVVLALNNPSPIWVNALTATMSPGGHHLVLERMPADSQLTEAPFPCDATGGLDETRLFIALQPTSAVTLPSGVAYRLEANQHLIVQLHYLNATDAPLNVRGEVELAEADSNVAWIEAASVFTGTFAIELRPHQVGRAQVDAIIGFNPAPAGKQRHVFALSTHTHHLSTRTSIHRIDAAGEYGALLYESVSWAEPPLTMFVPVLTLQPSERLRLTCDYLNPSDRVVKFGAKADDEMCMLWAHVYDL